LTLLLGLGVFAEVDSDMAGEPNEKAAISDQVVLQIMPTATIDLSI
jgi:hypothetical protein